MNSIFFSPLLTVSGENELKAEEQEPRGPRRQQGRAEGVSGENELKAAVAKVLDEGGYGYQARMS